MGPFYEKHPDYLNVEMATTRCNVKLRGCWPYTPKAFMVGSGGQLVGEPRRKVACLLANNNQVMREKPR